MSMILCGSYEDICEMYYAVKGEQIIRLEIYLQEYDHITAMYSDQGFSVTRARDTNPEVSNKFTELHSFQSWPKATRRHHG